MRMLVILFGALLGACANPVYDSHMQAAHYEAVTYCDSFDKPPEWKTNCYKAIMLRRQTEIAEHQAAQSRALMVAGAQALATPPPMPAPPMHCTSRRVGGAVNTSCY